MNDTFNRPCLRGDGGREGSIRKQRTTHSIDPACPGLREAKGGTDRAGDWGAGGPRSTAPAEGRRCAAARRRPEGSCTAYPAALCGSELLTG